MDKSRKKSFTRDPQRTAAVKWAAAQFGVSTAYVYGIISSNMDGGRADEIRKAYNQKYNQLKALLSQ